VVYVSLPYRWPIYFVKNLINQTLLGVSVGYLSNFMKNIMATIGIIFLSVIQFCGDNTSPSPTFDGKYFNHLNSYHIPYGSKLFQTAPADVVIDSLGNFYRSDIYEKNILKTRPPFRDYEILGNAGIGPAEYVNPVYLKIHNDMLYFSDMSTSLIKSIPVDPMRTNESPFHLTVNQNRTKFDINDSLLVVLNERYSPHVDIYEYYPDDEIHLLQELLSHDKMYDLAYMLNGGGVTIAAGDIYAMLNAPYVLYHFSRENTSEDKYSLIKEYNFENLPGVITWESKYNKVAGLSNQKELQELVLSFTRVNDFFLLKGMDGKQDILLTELMTPVEDGRSMMFHLFDLKNDELLATYRMPYTSIMAVHKNIIYTYTTVLPENDADPQIIIDEYGFSLQ